MALRATGCFAALAHMSVWAPLQDPANNDSRSPIWKCQGFSGIGNTPQLKELGYLILCCVRQVWMDVRKQDPALKGSYLRYYNHALKARFLEKSCNRRHVWDIISTERSADSKCGLENLAFTIGGVSMADNKQQISR